MEEQSKRKTLILTIIAVLTLLILIGGATYAYFQAQIGTGDKADVTVKAGTTDNLSFSLNDLDASKDKVVDNDNSSSIIINANQSNFAEGSNSIADGVTGTATLIANDENYSSSKTYNVYLNITKNELQYTSYIKKVPDETPENILSFKDETKKLETDLSNYNPRPELYLTIKKNGNEVTKGVTINDKALSYTSEVFTEGETQLGGFDITETKGLIKIEVPTTITIEGSADNHTTTDTWEITVTFMNLETDQHLNTGKSVVGEVLIQSEEYVPQDIKTLNQLLADANKDGKTTLYHHDGSVIAPSTITDLDDTSIIGGYKITSEYSDKYQKIFVDYHDEDYQEPHLIKYMCSDQETYLGNSCSGPGGDYPHYYTLDYASEKQFETYKQALNQALIDKYVEPDLTDTNDDSYRYAGGDYEINSSYSNQYKRLYASSDEEKGEENLIRYYCGSTSSEYYIGKSCIDPIMQINNTDIQSNTYLGIMEKAAEAGLVDEIVKNYVCLDGDKTTEGKCDSGDNNLYRIIGLFKNELGQYEMKLIRYDYSLTTDLGIKTYSDTDSSFYDADAYYKGSMYKMDWGSNMNKGGSLIANVSWESNKNEWTESSLRKTELNDYYLNTYLKTTKDINVDKLITTHVWQLNGNDGDYVSPKVMYNNEMNKVEGSPSYPTQTKTVNDKIGLMYVSDYGYAASPSRTNNWTKTLPYYSERALRDNNWMYMGLNEWTISRNSNYSDRMAYYISSVGSVNGTSGGFEGVTVRPCFYLSSDVQIKSGDGSKGNPYRLSV